VRIGGGEGMPEEPKSLRPYSVETREVVEAHPPHSIHVAHPRLIQGTGSRGADPGKLPRRIYKFDTTK
jgi:hypothetical protein